MTGWKTDAQQLRALLHPVLREIERGIHTGTSPEWNALKERLLQALELIRKLERDQLWSILEQSGTESPMRPGRTSAARKTPKGGK